MKVLYSRRAQSEMAEIFDYISAQNRSTAIAVAIDIRTACDRLGQFPYANAPTQRKNVFRMPVRKRGYTVFYRVRPRLRIVEIVRVVRGARVRNLIKVPR